MESPVGQATYEKLTVMLKPDMKPGQSIDFYNKECTNYEEMLCHGNYTGSLIAINEVERLVPLEQRERMRVIDVAAGTGRVGLDLRKIGFKNIDALEPAEGMMKLLKETNAYTHTFQEFLGVGSSSVPQGAYDMVTMVGGLGGGHVPVSGVDDLIRFAKPGALVIIVTRVEFMEIVEYKGRLEPHMDSLETRGLWRKVTKKVVPNYFHGKDGLVFIYRVL
ncbi:methyltransferase-like protein 27 [Panulirus ornatus]|uniref:methyltransferase-like protein 27 n=1 Tax=Panulirus ornatus TaxID=150431 RepID=UPI003A8C3967